MRLTYLAGAVAACGLIAGAAYAQPGGANGSASDTTAGASSGMSATPSPAGSAGAAEPGAPGASPAAQSPSASSPSPSSAAPSGMTGANAATNYGQSASVTVAMTTNGPIPDTPENRAKYGGPNSRSGRLSPANGN